MCPTGRPPATADEQRAALGASAAERATNDSGRVLQARLRFRAVGTRYLRFALTEPGLFQTAFSPSSHLESATTAARAGNSGCTPFQLLSTALDHLVTVGVLPAERRPGAEFLAWSAVHGLAALLIDGPLRSLDPGYVQSLIDGVVTMVEQGL